MSTGRLIAVVGPSGVGKDSVMAGLAAARPGLRVVRRAITRPAEAGGEDHEPVTLDEFARARDAGAYALSWGAHDLFYGIPADVDADLAAGHDVLANLSRGALSAAAARFAGLFVLGLTARPETLAARLAARGREDAGQIARRLDRQVPPPPAGVPGAVISNDGPLETTVAVALAALYPESA
ncbi:MAG: phosphonate metabolism protein/1,5-bisphosphokinase (PRPP-forming) PhnN [Limimaricola sp.]|uniref:phosphonate metabolism protein/1,5-bisphosphokinase (PRPP-forming) PhnN n=1 Tax=Limimaricola sp. TaxID=2211665 RepID=UPI001D9A5680|nr:phosphonate metabolism protein/1,5-bisphosphokinase (PRPP-forming) PhnN [Limimaricola sp.]MBI1416457.1 phosphonate metabolism protein/1,5-bisphosphokinase (PRPP-forming) PhnN [Limimaricola sp.]